MQVIFHKNFKKQTAKFKTLKTKIDQRLFLFIDDPFNPILNNHPLIGKYKGYRSINITADYRAVYESINDDLSLFITLDKHSNLYR